MGFALPLGNPAEPTLFRNFCTPTLFDYPKLINNIGVGYYGDFVFNRHLKNDAPSIIDRTEIMTNAGVVLVNFCNRADLFGTFGATTLDLHTFGDSVIPPGGSGPLQRPVEIRSRTDFSWSAGGRLSLLQCRCFGIGVEGQYFYTNPDLDYVFMGAAFLERPRGVSMKYEEWQAGISIYYRYDLGCNRLSSIVPYIGVKWSRALLDMDEALILPTNGANVANSITLLDCETSRDIGYGFGVTTMICSRFAFTVEGRFRDELAFHLNGQMRF
ncbi:MAG: hypothetical protein K1000chlam4_00287 [Chlamydiae bacterium]|nr:hypothetical protein [Chlamydiota bacterium]